MIGRCARSGVRADSDADGDMHLTCVPVDSPLDCPHLPGVVRFAVFAFGMPQDVIVLGALLAAFGQCP